jgi:predicted DNA-binding antitoxin AbrB/MazE fold protein
MTEVVTAVYERGALYPLTPLALQEHQRVRIQVMPEDQAHEVDEEDDECLEVINMLIAAGLVQPKPKGPVPPDPLSREERQALADRLGSVPGKSASEMVIEDRGEW